MIPIRVAVTCWTLMTKLLLNVCTADASKDDGDPSVAGQTSSTTTTPAGGPTQTHTPRPDSLDSMTPREVVNAPDANLVTVALAPGDPDVRLSTWTALCHWCPDTPDGHGGSLGPPTFTGMALTTDGYKSATYVRPRDPQLGGTVLSPRDDVFLLNDAGNGREWLVDLDDGTKRRVARVDTELRPADPRLWFECGIAGAETWCGAGLHGPDLAPVTTGVEVDRVGAEPAGPVGQLARRRPPRGCPSGPWRTVGAAGSGDPDDALTGRRTPRLDRVPPSGGVAGRGIRRRVPTGSRGIRVRNVRRWPVDAGRRCLRERTRRGCVVGRRRPDLDNDRFLALSVGGWSTA